MKTRIILAASILLTICGCKKPNQCEQVSLYAPFEISWTDYNCLDSVREYFNCHDSTLFLHHNDTVLVKGYFVKTNDHVLSFRNSKTEWDTTKWVGIFGGIPELDTTRMAKVMFRVECSPSQLPLTQPWWECCKRHLHLYIFSDQTIEYEDNEL